MGQLQKFRFSVLHGNSAYLSSINEIIQQIFLLRFSSTNWEENPEEMISKSQKFSKSLKRLESKRYTLGLLFTRASNDVIFVVVSADKKKKVN